MTLEELRRAAELLPDGASLTIPCAALLDAINGARGKRGAERDTTPAAATTWRERLWECPPETRLSVRDVAEALGRPRSYVYRAVAPKHGEHRLPASRFGGELVFQAGVVRAWVQRGSGSGHLAARGQPR